MREGVFMTRKIAVLLLGLVVQFTIALSFSAPIPAKEKTVTLEIHGMVWIICADEVRSALEPLKGVKSVKMSLKDEEVVVTYDPDVVKEVDLIKAVKNSEGMHPYEAKVKKKEK
jgi:mercuric ion binding protein